MRSQHCAVSLIALAALLALDVRVAAGDFSTPFTFEGMVYEAAPDGGPDPTPGEVLAIGDSYVVVATVMAFSDDLAPHVDPLLNEYMFVLSGGTVTQHSSSAGFHIVSMSGPVHCRLIADARAGGSAATFAPDPPNVSVPATFVDGSVVLETTLPDLAVYWNASSGDGGAALVVTFTGSLAPYVNPVPGSKNALQLAFETRMPAPMSGYQAETTGRVEGTWVLPVEHTSWGSVKDRYR